MMASDWTWNRTGRACRSAQTQQYTRTQQHANACTHARKQAAQTRKSAISFHRQHVTCRRSFPSIMHRNEPQWKYDASLLQSKVQSVALRSTQWQPKQCWSQRKRTNQTEIRQNQDMQHDHHKTWQAMSVINEVRSVQKMHKLTWKRARCWNHATIWNEKQKNLISNLPKQFLSCRWCKQWAETRDLFLQSSLSKPLVD